MLSGAQVFVPLPCPQCGVVSRARDKIGGYHLHEVLARSGLGIILRAVDNAGAALAIKLLQPPLVAESTDVEYFASEVWAIARLNHPNCLRIFATGVEQGTAWIAMEWLTHGSLADRLAERGKLRESEVLAIGVQAATALGAAHAAGHQHRDLEPNNFVFADARTLKITDFGQAALYQIAADDLGTMWGRTSYIAPERLRNEPEEAYSDIYSLGAVLFHALAGEPLHGGEPHGLNTLEMIESGDVRVEETVSPLHENTALVLNRMLTSEPTQRIQYWSEVVAQLTQAGTLVARRDAPKATPPQPRPVKRAAPAPAPAPKPPRDSSLLWTSVCFILLALTIAVGIYAWKRHAHLQPTPPPIAVASPLPQTPSPTPTPPPASPAATPAASGFDWRGWKTTALEINPSGAKASGTIDARSNALRLVGYGSGLAGEKDDAAFHFRALDGNWALATHVVAHDGAAGLCVRDSAASGAPSVSVWLTKEGTLAAATRKTADAKPELVAPIPAPKISWLRVTRRGSTLIAEYSANAKQSKPIGKLEGVPISQKPVAGFVVWLGTKERPATGVFDRVSIARINEPASAASPPRSPPPRSGSPPSSPPARAR
jgi:serine/threonine protein kinase